MFTAVLKSCLAQAYSAYCYFCGTFTDHSDGHCRGCGR